MRRFGFQGWLTALALGVLAVQSPAQPGERMPAQVAGSWRIVRILPTKNAACWDESQAKKLVGSTLTYRTGTMRWQGGEVPLTGVITRSQTPETFASENSDAKMQLSDLNIQSSNVMEVDLQHEDADITGSTTEVPGDSILLAGRDRIVVSACGVYYEATRLVQRASR
jgi:hypothetical protein